MIMQLAPDMGLNSNPGKTVVVPFSGMGKIAKPSGSRKNWLLIILK